MPCSDRQLQQSQIEAGFKNQRAGVLRAVRPFSGEPSGPNLVDYINRELFPAVKAGRDKLNEIFLQVADNAPSANPLAYYFSTLTTGGDPTSGRIKLDNATQNAATTIRVAELNARLVSAVAWLNVMAGSSTSPIGVVTLSDAINPGRFVRFNLSTMTDQGVYWDLGVTPVESSHDNPFVEGEAIVISFIAGVASGGVVPAPGFGMHAVSLSALPSNVINSLTNANDSLVSSGTLYLNQLANSNRSLNNVNYRLSGNSLVANAIIRMQAGTLAAFGDYFLFGNTNGISFGQQTTTVAAIGQMNSFTADFAGPRGVAGSAASTLTNGTLVFSNSNGVSFGLNGSTMTASVAVTTNGAISAGAASVALGTVVFSNSNGQSFGVNGSTVTGNFSGPRGVVVNASASTLTDGNLVFSNSNGVSFGFNGSTITASVGAGGAAGSISAGTTSVALGQVVFSNSNNVSFGLNGSTVTATATLPLQTFIGAIAGGTQTATSGTIVFSDSNGMSFGLSGSTRMTGNFAGARAVMGSDAASSLTNGTLVFSNLNGVSFGLNGSTMTASVGAGGAAGSIAVPGTTFALGQLVFSNSNLVSFGLNGSTMTAQARFLASHGAQSENVSRLAFAAGGPITLSLSTAAGAATLNIDVFPVMHLSAGTQTGSGGTMVFSNANGLSFGMAGSSVITGSFSAIKSISGGTTRATGPEVVFSNSNGVTFGVNGQTVTAQFGPPQPFWRNFYGMPPSIEGGGLGDWRTDMLYLFPLGDGHGEQLRMSRINTLAILMSAGLLATSQTASFSWVMQGGLYSSVNSTQLSLINSFSSSLTATTQATSVRSSNVHGARWWTVHSSQWSVAPDITQGANLWMGLRFAQTGETTLAGGIWCPIPAIPGQAAFKGVMGVGNTNAFSQRPWPFWGAMSTGAIPGSIGATQMLGKVTNATSQTAIGFARPYGSHPSIGIFSQFAVTH